MICCYSIASAQVSNSEWVTFKQNNSGLSSNSVKDIDFDEGKVWIATINGLNLLQDNNWEVYNTSNSDLLDNYVRSIAVAEDGTKWIGTSNGLISIDNNPSQRAWTLYNTSNSGLPVNNITSLDFDNQNQKWFGTWGGGIARYNENEWETYNMYNSELPVNGVYDIKIDEYDNIWIATHGGGLAKFDGYNWQIYNATNSNLPSNIVYAIDFDAQNNIWLGTELGLVKFDGYNHWTLFNLSNTGFDFSTVLCVKFEELTNTIYFGTYNGLGIYKSGVFSFKKTGNSGISNNWVSVINIDDNGNKWIGTLGGGISVYNENGVVLSTNQITENFNYDALSLYPNPVINNAVLNIKVQNFKNAGLYVFDLCGKVLFFQPITLLKGENDINLNFEAFSSGIYYCCVKSEDECNSLRFIKI